MVYAGGTLSVATNTSAATARRRTGGTRTARDSTAQNAVPPPRGRIRNARRGLHYCSELTDSVEAKLFAAEFPHMETQCILRMPAYYAAILRRRLGAKQSASARAAAGDDNRAGHTSEVNFPGSGSTVDVKSESSSTRNSAAQSPKTSTEQTQSAHGGGGGSNMHIGLRVTPTTNEDYRIFDVEIDLDEPEYPIQNEHSTNTQANSLPTTPAKTLPGGKVVYVKSLVGTLLELPCIIETYKSLDADLMFKSCDVSQMLYVYDPTVESIDIPTLKNTNFWECRSGLTPATHRIRSRKFRNLDVFDRSDIALAELEILELMRGVSREWSEIDVVSRWEMQRHVSNYTVACASAGGTAAIPSEPNVMHIIGEHDNIFDTAPGEALPDDLSDKMFRDDEEDDDDLQTDLDLEVENFAASWGSTPSWDHASGSKTFFSSSSSSDGSMASTVSERKLRKREKKLKKLERKQRKLDRRTVTTGATASKRPLQGQLQGQLQGPLQGQLQGPLQGQLQGPLQGQLQGPLQGQLQGPLQGPLQGQLQGQLQGPLQGQLQGPLQGQLQGPLQGPLQGQLQGPLQGPLQGQPLSGGLPLSSSEHLSGHPGGFQPGALPPATGLTSLPHADEIDSGSGMTMLTPLPTQQEQPPHTVEAQQQFLRFQQQQFLLLQQQQQLQQTQSGNAVLATHHNFQNELQMQTSGIGTVQLQSGHHHAVQQLPGGVGGQQLPVLPGIQQPHGAGRVAADTFNVHHGQQQQQQQQQQQIPPQMDRTSSSQPFQ